MGRASRRLRTRVLAGLTVLSAALGAEMLVAANPAGPPAPSAGDAPPGQTDTRAVARTAAPMARSEPTHVTISKISVDAEVIPIGVTNEGTLGVPPLDTPDLTGWYRLGPSPGEIGNAVIVGHVDSHKTGPAVFYSLGALRPGDIIAVTLRDNAIAQFTVDQVESYPKKTFPTDLLYGPARTPGLRLVTCGGQFDQKARSYLNNIVVSATLTSSQEPRQRPQQNPLRPAPT
jgi:sortase (surface protein transpeptidase)